MWWTGVSGVWCPSIRALVIGRSLSANQTASVVSTWSLSCATAAATAAAAAATSAQPTPAIETCACRPSRVSTKTPRYSGVSKWHSAFASESVQ